MIKVVGSLELEKREFEESGRVLEEELLPKLRTLVMSCEVK